MKVMTKTLIRDAIIMLPMEPPEKQSLRKPDIKATKHPGPNPNNSAA
jgi:hypothetical protein